MNSQLFAVLAFVFFVVVLFVAVYALYYFVWNYPGIAIAVIVISLIVYAIKK